MTSVNMTDSSSSNAEYASDVMSADDVCEKQRCGKEHQQQQQQQICQQSVGEQQPMLPPCRVCSEKASGFHYGVNTCEACKAFFRRSLRNKTDYQCTGSGDCVIQPGKRNACSACRLRKCIAYGMSTSAIKTGRYTHAKKAKDITEVKLLLAQQKQQPTQSSSAQSSSKPSPSEQCMDTDSVSLSSSAAAACDAVEDSLSPKLSPLSAAAASPSSPSSSSSSPLAFNDLEKIIDHITAVYVSQTPLTAEFIAALPDREKYYLEQKALKQQLFGPMKPLSGAEYNNIFNTTGIDIDGRRELLQSVLIDTVETCVKRFVNFVKAIPGFTQLPLTDQIALVKASRYDVWMILSQCTFNTKLRLHHSYNGTVLSMDDWAQFNTDSSHFESAFEIQSRLQSLHLSTEENCVLAAFTVMSTDRCPLEDRRTVEQCQMLLLDCLLYLCAKNHAPNDSLFFARIVAVLVQLRSGSVAHSQADERFITEWRDKVDFPPVFLEIWS